MGFFDKIKTLTGIKSVLKNQDTSSVYNTKLLSNLASVTILEQQAYLNAQHQNQKFNLENLFQSFSNIHKTIKNRKLIAKRLQQLAPDIAEGFHILAVSIVSPNDFRDYQLLFHVDHQGYNTDVKEQIIKLLNDHFNNQLHISEKLIEWIQDVLSESGSKAIAILPKEIINNLMQLDLTLIQNESKTYRDLTKYSSAFESFDAFIASLEGNTSINKQEITKIVNIALEAAKENIQNNEEFSNDDEIKKIINDSNGYKFSHNLTNLFSKISTKIKFIKDNRAIGYIPTVIQKNKKSLKKQQQLLDQANQILKSSRYIDVLDLFDTSKILNLEDDADGYPVLMELPSESVIPIFAFEPSNHIGYIILLDENGLPLKLKVEDEEFEKINYSLGEGRALQFSNPLVEELFKSMYGNNKYFQLKSSTGTLQKFTYVMFKEYINSIIKHNLTQFGLVNFDFKIRDEIHQSVLYHVAKRNGIRMLFLPANMVCYLAFDYDENGIGKSKIDDIEFALSLRVSTLVARVYAMLEAAINRRRLNVSFDENVVPNPNELLHKIRRTFINSRLLNFSYEPAKILKSLAEKSIVFKLNNLPGVEQFEIEDEPAEYQLNAPDTDLQEEIKNMLIYNVGVPPTVLNSLADNEYSRSVVTNNGIYALKVRGYQKTVNKFLSKLVKTYILFSPKLKLELWKIISPYIQKEENEEEKGTTIAEAKSISLTEDQYTQLYSLIKSIKVHLPSPKIAFDKAMNEELNEYLGIIDGIIEKLFPDELINDENLANTYKLFKAYAMYKSIKTFMEKTGAKYDFDIPTVDDIDITELANFTLALQNIDKGLKDFFNKLKKKISSGEEGGTSGSGGSTGGGWGF